MPTCPHHHPLAVSHRPLPVDRTIPPRRSRDGDPDGDDGGDDGAEHDQDRRVPPDQGGAVGSRARVASQDGSVATEYGLLAVVAATIVSVLLEWATSGGITALLTSILARVSELVGL